MTTPVVPSPIMNVLPTPDPGKTVPASALIAFVDNDQEIDWKNVTITGPVNLRGRTINHPISLEDCTFSDSVDFAEARFKRSVNLNQCSFEKNFSFSLAHVGGHLDLTEVTIGPDPKSAEKAADFRYAQIGGNLTARSLNSEVTLDLTGIKITGDLDGSSTGDKPTICHGSVNLVNAKIAGNVRWQGVLITKQLNLDLADVEGHVLCHALLDRHEQLDDQGVVLKCSVFGKGVSMRGAVISGWASFQGALLGLETPSKKTDSLQVFNLQSAEIKGGLFCRAIAGFRTRLSGMAFMPSTHIWCQADFAGILVFGRFDLLESVIEGTLNCGVWEPWDVPQKAEAEAQSWWLEHVQPPSWADETKEDASRNQKPLATSATGSVNMNAIVVKGDANFSFARFVKTLDLDQAKIAGDLNLGGMHIGFELPKRNPKEADPKPREPNESKNSLKAVGIEVGRQLRMNSIRARRGLWLQSAQVRGGLFCRPLEEKDDLIELRRFDQRRSWIGGKVNMAWITVTGTIEFTGTYIGGSLSLDGAAIEGDVRLLPRLRPFEPGAKELVSFQFTEVRGGVTLDSATVQGKVDVHGGEIHDNLSLRGATVRGRLAVRPQPVSEKTLKKLVARLNALPSKPAGLAARLNNPAKHFGALAESVADWFISRLPDPSIDPKKWKDPLRPEDRVRVNEALMKPEALLPVVRIIDKADPTLGKLDLRDANVHTLQLHFDPPQRAENSPTTLWYSAVRLWQRFRWWGRIDQTAGRRPQLCTICLEGCRFEELEPPLSDYYKMIDVLATQPVQQYTYVSTEKWFRDRGYTRDAVDLYVSMRRRRAAPCPCGGRSGCSIGSSMPQRCTACRPGAWWSSSSDWWRSTSCCFRT